MTTPTQRRRVMIVDPVSQFLGAHDREIGRGLAARGHEVVLVTTEGYPFDSACEPFAQIPLFRGVGGSGGIFAKGGNYLAALFRTWRYALANRIDTVVLYYHLLPSLDGLWVRLLRLSGIRVVVCVHDVLPLTRQADRLGTRSRLYRGASELVTFSAYAKRRLLQLLDLPEERVSSLCFGLLDQSQAACPLGAREGACAEVDGTPGETCEILTYARRDARSRLGWPLEDAVVLCFGQIKSNKGLEYLLPAFSTVLESAPHAKLRVVGRPWKVDMAPVLKLAEELGLTDRVHFQPEFIPEEEVSQYLQAADVVVLPYTALYQSAVLPLACVMCKPIVATRVGSIPEVVEDGNSAYVVPPCDAPALAAALALALGDHAEAQRRGCRARQKARRIYSWDTLCDGLSRLVEGTAATEPGEGALDIDTEAARTAELQRNTLEQLGK